MIVCKTCSAEISKGAIFCPMCGFRTDGKKKCGNCQTLQDEKNAFCESCGNKFENEKTVVVAKIQPKQSAKKDTLAKKTFRQKITGEGNKTNFILNCVALAFAVASLFIMLFAPINKTSLDFVVVDSESGSKGNIVLSYNYIDTTSAVSQGFFNSKKDWGRNKTKEKFQQSLLALVGFSSSEHNFKILEKNLKKLNLAELTIISDALTEQGIKTPSLYWMTINWLAITAAIVLDLIILVYLLVKIIKVDLKKYRPKLLTSFIIILFSIVFVFGGHSNVNVFVAVGKISLISSAVVLPIVFFTILAAAYLAYDIIEKGFKKISTYIIATSGALLALLIGLASQGSIINVKTDTDDEGYLTKVTAQDSIEILDSIADYSWFTHTQAKDTFGVDAVTSKFLEALESAGNNFIEFKEQAHSEYTISLLSSYEFTSDEIGVLVVSTIMLFGYSLAAILPALAIIFSLKRLVYDENYIKKLFIISIICAAVFTFLLILNIVTVCVLNNSDVFYKTQGAVNTVTVTFNTIIAVVLAAGLFTLYLVKTILNKKTKIETTNTNEIGVIYED